MEGIKEAIAYITGLAVKAEDPKTVEINGKTYCTKDLVRYDAPEKAALRYSSSWLLTVASGSLRRWQMSRRTSRKHSKTYRTETRSQSLHNVTDINVGIIKGGPAALPHIAGGYSWNY